MVYCLPKPESAKFLAALRAGDLLPSDLRRMSSEQRTTEFTKHTGADNAHEVNLMFEKQLLLPDQIAAMRNWANNLLGLNDVARKNIVDKIQGMSKILQPGSEKAFLRDLTADKLGVNVTAQEAKEIFDLSNKAAEAKTEMLKDFDNVDNRVAYGNTVLDLQDKIDSLKPNGQTLVNRLLDVASIPKSMLTSVLHFSAPFVQGWGMMSTARAWEGFGQMFSYFSDEANYRNLNAYIISHPDFALAKDGRLGLTGLTDQLSKREEAIQSTLVEKANKYLSDKTGVPNLVRASSRAFTGYLNYVRFNRFTDLLSAARLSGENVSIGSSVVSDLAKVVNDFTGRGAIGVNDSMANEAVLTTLNTTFFSPRKISATVNMFNPERYVNPGISKTARIAAARQLTGSLLATGAVLGLAAALGAEVGTDPRAANFAKIGLRGVHLDVTGGNAIYLRLLARMATNQEITSKGKLIELGKGYKPTTRADLAGQYVRGKLSPIAGFLGDALIGSDPVGRPFSIEQEARDKMMPIFIGSMLSMFQNDPENTAAVIPALSGIFGVGVESSLPPLSRTGLTVWGEKVDPIFHPGNKTNIDQEFTKLGIKPMSFPPQTINGVKLSDDQYHDYIMAAGVNTRAQLDHYMSSPDWDGKTKAEKVLLINTVRKSVAAQVKAAIMIQDGGKIMEESSKIKEDKALAEEGLTAETKEQP